MVDMSSGIITQYAQVPSGVSSIRTFDSTLYVIVGAPNPAIWHLGITSPPSYPSIYLGSGVQSKSPPPSGTPAVSASFNTLRDFLITSTGVTLLIENAMVYWVDAYGEVFMW